MKQKIRLTESQLHRVIKESVKRLLKESVSEIVEKLHGLEDQLIQEASEIRHLYFANERYFDTKHRFDNMGLDNPLYSYGSQGELSDAFDKERWNEFTQGQGPDFATELRQTYEYYQRLTEMCDSEGYGIGAGSRGFDVTRPIGVLWTKSQNCVRILRQMAGLTGVEL